MPMGRKPAWYQTAGADKQAEYDKALSARQSQSRTFKSISAESSKASTSPFSTAGSASAGPVAPLPPRKSHHKAKTTQTKVTNPGPLDDLKAAYQATAGKYKELPEDDAARDAALAPYKYTARTVMLGESKLRQLVLDGEPADKQEMDAGIEAWAGFFYSIGFNALHPAYALIIFNASFLGPDLIKQREKIFNFFNKRKGPKPSVDKTTVEYRQAGPGVVAEVKVTEQSGNPPIREVKGERVA